MQRKERAATISGVFLILMAGALVLVNMLAYAKNGRIDLTKNERFTLSKGSARLVSQGLNEQMDVTLYVTRGLPKTDLFVADLVNLMSEYERASGGKLKYVVREPKTEEEKKEAEDAGLQKLALGEGSETGDQTSITQGFMGIVFEYGSERQVIPVLSPDQTQGLEFWVTNKIREIRDRADESYAKVGVIVKDGIKLVDATLVPPQGGRPGPNIKGLIQQYFPFYKIEDVDLQDGEAEIDPELRGVIILQADKDWTEKELARVDQFLMKGDKSLLVIAGAVNMKASDATMKAELSTRGLEKLLDGYGIELKNEVVLDWQTQMRIPISNNVGRLDWISAPGILQIQHDDGAKDGEQTLDNAFAGFFRLEELSFPYASPLVAHVEKQAKAKFTTVVRSSATSTVETDARIDLSLTNEFVPKGEQGQRVLALAVEGPLTSAFAGKAPEGIEIAAESASPSRLLVIASPQFLVNPFARAGNPPPMPPQMAMMGMMGGDRNLQMVAGPYARQMISSTIISFKNLLDWMSGDQDLLAVSAKLLGDPNLSYSDIPKPDIKMEDSEDVKKQKYDEWRQGRTSLQQKVQWALTLLPSLLFAAFGISRWRMREANRDQVKLDV